MRRLRDWLGGELPFDFNCGFVGYFGYELKADCEGDAAHRSSDARRGLRLRRSPDRLRSPGAAHLRPLRDRAGRHGGRASAGSRETSLRLASLAARSAEPEWAATSTEGEPAEFRLSRPHERYLDDIATCKQRLFEGETYEVCLTNKIAAEIAADPLPLYRTLRRVNPAPFSAFLRFGEHRRAELLARALPQRRPRPLGRGEADQGHLSARRDPRRGRAA